MTENYLYIYITVKSREKTTWNCWDFRLTRPFHLDTHVFLGGMRSEFSGKHVQYVLIYPSAFGERGEREIIRIDFSQTWEGENKNRQLHTSFRWNFSLLAVNHLDPRYVSPRSINTCIFTFRPYRFQCNTTSRCIFRRWIRAV